MVVSMGIVSQVSLVLIHLFYPFITKPISTYTTVLSAQMALIYYTMGNAPSYKMKIYDSQYSNTYIDRITLALVWWHYLQL